MLREICTLIETLSGFTMASGILQPGHRLQNAPDRCVLVAESATGEPNFYCPDMANFHIQVLTRAKSYMVARDDAWTVYNAIHGTGGWNMPRLDGLSGEDYLAMVIEAIGTPAYIGQDVNGRFEFSTNYIFRCEEASCGP